MLVALIEDIGRMVGIAAIGPSLHPTELSVGLVGADGIDEHGEPRFVRGLYTAVMACLLERDEVIFSILECLAKRDRVLDNPWTRVRTYAMPVRGCVFD